MSNHKGDTSLLIPRQRPVPAAYRDGAVSIAIPTNPSTPVSKTPLAPFVRLYTGLPVDPPSEDDAEPPPSVAKRRRRTPLSTSKPATSNSTPRQAGTPSSTTKSTVTVRAVSSTPLSALSTESHSHSNPTDTAETFAATRLESLIPLPFIAVASDSRRNAILPPSSPPKPQPTRHTILFDAAHALIMHQSVFNGTAVPSWDGLRSQLDELTNITGRQAKFILELESENGTLRKLAAKAGLMNVPGRTPTPTAPVATKNDKKRKRREEEKAQTGTAAAAAATTVEEDENCKREKENKKRKRKRDRDREREKQAGNAYMDGRGKKVEGAELQKQRAEREQKMAVVRRQQESMVMRDSSSSSSGSGSGSDENE